MAHIIVHSLNGDFLALRKVGNQERLLSFDSVVDWAHYDDLSRKVYSEENVPVCADSPLAVRYCIQGDTESGFLEFYVLEFVSDSAVSLYSNYVWRRIDKSLLCGFEKVYGNEIMWAIRNIALETSRASNVITVPQFALGGFLCLARRRITSCLREYGYKPEGCLKQLQSGDDSMVFNIKTNRGIIFHKVSGHGSLEATFTKKLAELLPNHALAVFGVDTDKNSFYSEDFGDTYTEFYEMENSELKNSLMDDAMEKFAHFHIDAIEFVGALKTTGMDDTGPETLKKEFCGMARRLRNEEILCDKDVGKLMDLIPEVELLLNTLIESGIPSTVCHGDLTLWNMTEPFEDGEPRLFDWYEATISHPFLDIVRCDLGDEDRYLGYLSVWKIFASTKALVNALSAAILLEPLWEVYRVLKIRSKKKDKLMWDVEKISCRISMRKFIRSVEPGNTSATISCDRACFL